MSECQCGRPYPQEPVGSGNVAIFTILANDKASRMIYERTPDGYVAIRSESRIEGFE